MGPSGSEEAMPPSIWNGTITFGLAAVPIKVHGATEDKGVHFHQVHAKDGARIQHKRICSKDGNGVAYKQVAKGYEVRAGEYVMLSQEEIAVAAGEHSRFIELEEFVRREEIDPVFYDRGYHLGAGEDGQDAYRLLHDALQRSGRVGIGRWVFHNREYLVAIRPRQQVLTLHTMRFAAELADAAALDIDRPSRGPSKRELEMAEALVEGLHDRFRPEAFEDNYRQRVLALIEAKAKGEEPKLAEVDERAEPPDLMAALEASLSASDGGRGRSSKPKPRRKRPRRKSARSRS